MKTVLRQAVIITVLAALFGLLVNSPLLIRYARGEFREGFVSGPEVPDIVSATLEEVEDHFANDRNIVFIDSRPPEQYASGHIPGARNLPLPAADKDKTLRLDRWHIDTEALIIVYCSGGQCLDSLKLALWLKKRGFKEIAVFRGGWTDWSRAGLPVEVGRIEK
jgi:rhodanese-related sulfurtransferase